MGVKEPSNYFKLVKRRK